MRVCLESREVENCCFILCQVQTSLTVMIKWKTFDSLNKWRLEWGVGEGKLRGGAFYKLKEGFST